MPNYDFSCSCGHLDSENRLMADSNAVKICDNCGADMKRVYGFGGHVVK